MRPGPVRLALRAHLRDLEVCTTGSTTLAATSAGYTRASGSFLDDGFRPGMEVTPSGFTASTVGTVLTVSALAMTIRGGRTVESSASGRSLTVGLPATQVWENTETEREAGVPYVAEQFLPGASKKVGLGSFGEVETLPLYIVQVYVPQDSRTEAADAYAGAILEHFAPETSLTVANASLRVRGDVAPFCGQLLQSGQHAVVPVTIPLRLRAANTV